MDYIISRTKAFWLSVVILGMTTLSFAQGVFVSSEITYQQIGDKLYTVNLAVYAECGSSFDLTTKSSFPISFYSDKLMTDIDISSAPEVTLTKSGPAAGEEITLFCETIPTTCSGGTERGVKRYEYSGTLDLSAYDYTDDWTLFFERFSRSPQTNTAIIDDQTNAVVARTFFSNENGFTNSSPTYSTDAVVSGSVGESKSISFPATDADGDELRYVFSTPESSIGVPITYKPGFDSASFVGGAITLDENTGDLVVNSDTLDEIGITDIRIEEYRDGELIGWSTRGIQIETFDASNAIPELSGFNDPDFTDLENTTYTICVGEVINFGDLVIYGQDGDAGQLLDMTVAAGPNASKFFGVQNSASPQGRFFWSPSDADVGDHAFTIKLEDDGCPQPQSAQKTYTISIRPRPIVDLPTGHIIRCDVETVIDSFVTAGTEPYTYNWREFTFDEDGDTVLGASLAIDDVLTTTEPNNYFVEVIDDAGCSGSDTISLLDGLTADFEFYDRCNGDITSFIDSSSSALGSIVEWDWDFGHDGETSTDQNPLHQFPGLGTYDVKLTVTNDVGCVKDTTQSVTVCDPPTPFWAKVGHCSRDFVLFEDVSSTATGCGVKRRTWTVPELSDSATYEAENFQQVVRPDHQQIFPDSGWYHMDLTVESWSGCVTRFTTDSFFIDPKPIVMFIEDQDTLPPLFYVDCADPDTMLKSNIMLHGTPYLNQSRLPYDYIWTGAGTVVQDTALSVTGTGTYMVEVIDSLGCSDQTQVSIVFPLLAGITYEPVCTPDDTMQLRDQSVSNRDPIVSWEWDFGDGSTGSGENPRHYYDDKTDYTVKLKVTDGNTCEDSVEIVVYNTYFVERFNIFPDTVPICVSDDVLMEGPYEHPVFGSHIDTITWNNGLSGDWRYYVPPAFGQQPTGDVPSGYSVGFQYGSSTIDSTDVTYEIVYNAHPEVHSGFCVWDTTGKVRVWNAVQVTVEPFRICVGDTSEITYERIQSELNAPINFQTWTLEKSSVVLETSNDSIAKFVFTDSDPHQVFVYVRDTIGCDANFGPVTVYPLEIPKPSFVADTQCANDPVSFDLGISAGDPQTADLWYMIYDSDTIGGPGVFNNTSYFDFDYKHTFNSGGWHTIGLFLEDNEETQCRNWLFDSVLTWNVPEPSFTFDTVCAEQVVQFTNTTVFDDSGDDQITGYQWNFGDGATSDEENPSHTYAQGGFYTVTLTTFTQFSCSVSTIDNNNMYVRHKPVAGFYVDTEVPEANTPLPFIDTSQSPTVLTESFYDFMDGNTSTEFNPFHTYEEIDKYFVTHSVTTEEGCSDTTTQQIDLNVYLDLPNAFSPNDDSNNDDLFLIYKSIRELYEYKIYNRWGQLIFDGGSDLEAVWDGTYEGEDQEMGVYVAHVKALGAYGIQFNFKKNVTLLR